jgi:hypothetical protein
MDGEYLGGAFGSELFIGPAERVRRRSRGGYHCVALRQLAIELLSRELNTIEIALVFEIQEKRHNLDSVFRDD